MTGRTFALENDDAILAINSPRSNVGGPYKVVHKHLEERWVIIAFDWDGQPRLGIRWFWGNAGNPFSSAHATWLVIPQTLSVAILKGLPLEDNFKKTIEKFLNSEILGTEL